MNDYSLPFQNLEAWKDTKGPVMAIYKMTKSFPEPEKFGLTNQITIPAVAAASNLAAGISRTSLKDQAYFSPLAYSSLIELACRSPLHKKPVCLIKNISNSAK